MNEDWQLAVCIIKVLCLLVIAMSVHRIANPRMYSYMAGAKSDLTGPAGMSNYGRSLPHAVEVEGSLGSSFVGDGQHESPVFYNVGSLEDLKRSQMSDASSDAVISALVRLNTGSYVGTNKDTQRASDYA
jgi:hypothetical protein